MKTGRRGFLGRLIAGAAAVVGAGALAPSVARAEARTESQRVQALHDDMLANPEQYPELWARVREIMGRVQAGYCTWDDFMESNHGIEIGALSNEDWSRVPVNIVVLKGVDGTPDFELPNPMQSFSLPAGTYLAPPGGIDLRGASNVTISGVSVDQTVITHPPTELANRCMTCGWVGSWSADTSDRRLSDGLNEYNAHAEQEHGGKWSRDTVWRPAEPPTFEAMAADCAARGCSLNQAHNLSGGYIITHGHPNLAPPWPSFDEQFHSSPLTSTGIARVDAWRRSLHQDATARRWQAIDEARAESRQALGLPLEREPSA